jgi:hypothetical protein
MHAAAHKKGVPGENESSTQQGTKGCCNEEENFLAARGLVNRIESSERTVADIVCCGHGKEIDAGKVATVTIGLYKKLSKKWQMNLKKVAVALLLSEAGETFLLC